MQIKISIKMLRLLDTAISATTVWALFFLGAGWWAFIAVVPILVSYAVGYLLGMRKYERMLFAAHRQFVKSIDAFLREVDTPPAP